MDAVHVPCLARQDEPQGVFSHASALTLHDLSDVMPAKLDMTVPPGFRRMAAIPGVLRLHHARLSDREVQTIDGVRVTTPTRTLIDVIAEGVIAPELQVQAVDQALRRGLIMRRQLFALGVRVGNYTVCGDAAFYFVRAGEYDRASAKDFGEDAANQLLSMLPALEFVERVSGTRRTQALLTQGSVHRHVGRWQDIGLDRFLPHAMAAIRLYQRVLHRALPRGHLTFALNAAAYMIDVCIKLLRFDADSTAASVILAHARSASDGAATVIAALRPEAMAERDREIQAEIGRVLPILQYVIAVHDSEPGGVTDALVATVINLRDIVADHRKPRRARAKQLGALLRNVNRAARFTHRTSVANRSATLQHVQPSWRSRLQETSAFVAGSRDTKLQRALEQFLALLEGPDPA